MSSYVIGFDVGSQGLKVVVADRDGRTRGSAYRDYPIVYPRPGWAEQDANLWLEALADAVPQALARAGVDGRDVVALGLDAYVDAVVPVDEAGEPLRPCFLWMDRRAIPQAEAMGRRIGLRELFSLTGLNADSSHVAPKILWVRENEPHIYERTYKFLMPASFLVHRLTGEFVLDYSNASSTMIFDVSARTWSEPLLKAVDIDPARLPRLAAATDVAGPLDERWAKRLGLRPGIPVVVGSGDEHASCVGAGVVAPGLVCDIGGTAEPVAAVVERPVFDESGLVELHCHADPKTWLLENPGFVSGANLRWFRDNFAQAEKGAASSLGLDVYELLTMQASAVPAGSEGLIVLPCFMGAMTPEWNALARGTVYGLTLGHTRRHLVRAILEASAYGLRDIVDRMVAMGVEVREIRLVAGAARSALWQQIKADVTGFPVTVPEETECAALGSAFMALVGAGIYGRLSEVTERAVRIVQRRNPDPDARKQYEKAYQLYRELYDRLRPVFERGAQLFGL